MANRVIKWDRFPGGHPRPIDRSLREISGLQALQLHMPYKSYRGYLNYNTDRVAVDARRLKRQKRKYGRA